jgi:hypothetical protein
MYISVYRESNIYETAEKSQRQQFKCNFKMGAVINLPTVAHKVSDHHHILRHKYQ